MFFLFEILKKWKPCNLSRWFRDMLTLFLVWHPKQIDQWAIILYQAPLAPLILLRVGAEFLLPFRLICNFIIDCNLTSIQFSRISLFSVLISFDVWWLVNYDKRQNDALDIYYKLIRKPFSVPVYFLKWYKFVEFCFEALNHLLQLQVQKCIWIFIDYSYRNMPDMKR